MPGGAQRTVFLAALLFTAGNASATQMPIGPDAARHLLNRTGFEAHPAQIDAIGRLSRTEAIERVLAGGMEFGRRPQENSSNGTDHGTAAAHFLAGGMVRGGLYGQAPRLDRLEGGNLAYAVDFRSLYATALERWWGMGSEGPLRGKYPVLEVLRG